MKCIAWCLNQELVTPFSFTVRTLSNGTIVHHTIDLCSQFRVMEAKSKTQMEMKSMDMMKVRLRSVT
jgi:hypothetical protein